MLECVKNKVAIVTGASRGIGKAIAEHLAMHGATVIGTATTETGEMQISFGLQKLGNCKSFGIVLDIKDPDKIKTVLQKILLSVGEPLILINNAGITKDNLFLRMTEEEWFDVINTNLSGIFRLTKACIKFMLKARWGRIINISSVVAFTGNSGQVNYAAAKSGITGFSKSLAQEVATRNVTVNVVAPGFIDTDMTKFLPDNIRQQLLNKIPMGRLGNVDEVAKAVMFLLSDNAGYITGTTIHVNGGMLMN